MLLVTVQTTKTAFRFQSGRVKNRISASSLNRPHDSWNTWLSGLLIQVAEMYQNYKYSGFDSIPLGCGLGQLKHGFIQIVDKDFLTMCFVMQA